MTSMSDTHAVLFDIDGTLLVTGGAGGVAWQHAFQELHGIDVDVAEHTEAGMTDPEIAAIIFREVIGREGDAVRARAGHRRLSAKLPEAVAESEGYRLMPGVEEVLDRLIDAGMLLGLVTGNIEAAAHVKLSRGNLNRFFSFGGYGSDSADRTEVTKAALRRGELVSGGTLGNGGLLLGRRHPARRQGRTRRRDQGGRRRHRQVLRRGTPRRPAPTGRSRPSRTGFPS